MKRSTNGTKPVSGIGFWLLFLTVILAAVGGFVFVMSSGASAEADYYNNSSGVVQPDVPNNATLQNILELAVELSPNLIGTGEQDPSGTGFQGILLTGLAFAGATVASIIGVGVGPIGGSIIGAMVSYGLVDLGFAPPWIKPLLLFGIGTLAYIGFRRVLD